MAIIKSQSLRDIYFCVHEEWGGGGGWRYISVTFAKNNNDINTKFKMSAPNLHITRQIVAFGKF